MISAEPSAGRSSRRPRGPRPRRRHNGLPPPRWTRIWRLLVLALFVVLVGVLLISGYRAYRFTHHAVTVDAVILDSDVGCLFASGMPSATGGAITYRVRFPITGGSHITDVTRPCDVIPPDFGRGRGAIWVQYDVGDPDRVRVLNDHTDEVRTQVSAFMLAAYAVAALTLLALRRRRRTGASRSDRGRPADTA